MSVLAVRRRDCSCVVVLAVDEPRVERMLRQRYRGRAWRVVRLPADLAALGSCRYCRKSRHRHLQEISS